MLRVSAGQYGRDGTCGYSALQDAQLLAMHAFNMPRDVHLLLGAVVAVRALELRLLAALPLLMIPQGALQLVVAPAVRTFDALVAARTGRRVGERRPLQ